MLVHVILRLNYQIHTIVYLKTHIFVYVCEGKQHGNKLHVYIRSVWQQRNYTVNKSINPLLSSPLRLGLEICFVLISAAKDSTVSMLCSNFRTALELVTCCHHNSCAVGGNLQIKGWKY